MRAGREDVVETILSDDYPGKNVNRLVAACRMAGWVQDTETLRRALPPALQAIDALGDDPRLSSSSVGYWLLDACVRAKLFHEAIEVGNSFGYSRAQSEDLLSGLWSEPTQDEYVRARAGWLHFEFSRFRAEAINHHFGSAAPKNVVKALFRIGDREGAREAAGRFEDLVANWKPECGWIACAVYCHAAVAHAIVGDATASGRRFAAGLRLFEGREPHLPLQRGDRSLMASFLSEAYLDVGDHDLAARFSRKVGGAADKRAQLLQAFIVGGQIEKAEAVLVKVPEAEDRLYLIGVPLLKLAGALLPSILRDRTP